MILYVYQEEQPEPSTSGAKEQRKKYIPKAQKVKDGRNKLETREARGKSEEPKTGVVREGSEEPKTRKARGESDEPKTRKVRNESEEPNPQNVKGGSEGRKKRKVSSESEESEVQEGHTSEELEVENDLRTSTPGVNLLKKKKMKTKVKKPRKNESYATHLYKVQKQVNPDLGISKKAMITMNDFMVDMFERIATEASNLSKYRKRQTIGHKDIQAAVRLLLPGALVENAVFEAKKAVQSFSRN